MRGLEELKSIDDGGSFNRLVKKSEELANGDKSLSQKLLTEFVLKDFIAMKRKKLLAVDEKESNFVNLNIRIPKKIRSKRCRHASRIESSNKSTTERCFLGVVEEEGQTVKKAAVKKQSKADSCLEEEDRKKKRTTSSPTDLPQEFKDRIKRMNGTNVMLVIQKELTRSDKNNHLARFSIPKGQVRSHKFLTDEEKFKLNQKSRDRISCSLIQPCLEKIIDLEFKKWDMNNTFMYSLIKKWKHVANYSKNQLAEGSKVQLWSFRVDSQLWFAMIKL